MKDKTSKILIVLLCVILVFNFMQIRSLEREIETLRSSVGSMETTMKRAIWDAEEYLHDELTRLLTESESLLSNVSTEVDYVDKQIVLTTTAVPKELKTGETMWLSVQVHGETLSAKFDANNQAQLRFAPTESVTPVVQFKSNEGMRQQILDEMYVVKALFASVLGDWTDESWETYEANIIIEPNGDELLPFTADEIIDAYCVVQEYYVNDTAPEPVNVAAGYAPSDMEVPTGERVDVTLVQDDSPKAITFRANFAEFAAREQMDVEYHVHFILTTKDGLTYYSSVNPILDFDIKGPMSGSRCDFVVGF